jgi:hypothetical protein
MAKASKVSFSKKKNKKVETRSFITAMPFAFSGLLVSLTLSWILLAIMNFSYGFWHDYGGIGAAIDQYGPANLYREGFHLTSREQRIELFSEINKAIHNKGQGLESISYTLPHIGEQTLLREPEIIHLQDVANLITSSIYIALTAFIVWLFLVVLCVRKSLSFPSLRDQGVSMMALLSLATLVVIIVGPVEVFYKLHIWIFPEDHEWFFYYQDSLMSTMMKAPILFGWIAIEWVLLTVLCFFLLQSLVDKLIHWIHQINFSKS